MTKIVLENISEDAIYNILEKIKRLPVQSQESLEDAFGLTAQLTDTAALMDCLRRLCRESPDFERHML